MKVFKNKKLLFIVLVFIFGVSELSANTPPEVTSTALASAMEDSSYRYTLEGSDVDGDSLSWSVTEGTTLQSWLSLTATSSFKVVGTTRFSTIAGNSSVAIDGNDTLYVAYMDYSNGSKATVMKYNGVTWEVVGDAGFSATHINYTSIAIDGNNTPYVAYRDGNVKATVMRYNGVTWEVVGTAGFSAGIVANISMVIDGNNTPYVVYKDGLNNNKATVMSYNGVTWDVVGTAGFTAGGVESISMVVDSENTPYVGYLDVTNNSKATVMRYNGVTWEVVGIRGFSAGTVGSVSIAIDSDNTLYAAYKDYSNGYKATVMSYNGVTWDVVGTAGFSAERIDSISIEIDRDNTPNVLYQSSSKPSMKRYNGVTWEVLGAEGFTTGGVESISMVIDSENIPYVGYIDTDSYTNTVMKFNRSSLSGTPTNSDVGVYDINLSLSDGVSSVEHNFIIKVDFINDAPTSADINITIDEDTNKTFSTNDFNFTDADAIYGDTLNSIFITALPDKGALTLDGSEVTLNQEILVADIGNLAFTPVENANGTPYTTFDFYVNDGEANATSANRVTLNVNALYDEPTVTSTPLTTSTAGTPYSYLPTFSSNDNLDISYAYTSSLPDWATGFHYETPTVPDVLFSGAFINKIVGDTHGNIYLQSIMDGLIEKLDTDGNLSTVYSDISEPLLLNVDSVGNIYLLNTMDFTVTKVDLNATVTLIDSNCSNPNALVVDSFENIYIADTANSLVKKISKDGNITNIDGNFSNPIDMSVDSAGNVYVADIGSSKVKKIDMNGVVSTIEEDFMGPSKVEVDAEGNLYVLTTMGISLIDINGVRTDMELRLVFGSSMALDKDGNIYYASDSLKKIPKVYDLSGTPTNADTGVYDMNISVNDGVTTTAHNFQFTVERGANNLPEIVVDSELSLQEDMNSSLMFSVSDIDGDSVSVTMQTTPSKGMVVIDGMTITYTPNANFNGSDSFTVKFDDGFGGIVTKTINVTVSSVNDIPTITIDSTLSTNEDNAQSLTFSLADVEDRNLTLAVDSNATNGTVTINGTDISYTPNANYNGADSFIVSTTDADGAKVTKTINVTVASINDTPTITIDSTLSTDEDSGQSLTFSLADIEDSTLTLAIDSNATNGTVTINGTDISYTPNANYNGTDSFTVSTTDSDGAKVTQTVTVTVQSINDKPVVVIDSTLTTQEDGSSSLSFSVTDVDGDRVEATITVEPEYGTTVINDTTLTYTPTLNYNGTDSFTLTFNDGYGGVVTQTITVDVSSVNDEPTITIGSTIVVNEDGSSNITFTYYDIDGDIVQANLEQSPSNGIVEILNSTITYTPTTGFSGNDSFEIGLSDLNGYVTMKTVNVTVLAKTIEVDVNPTNTNQVTSQESVLNENNSTTQTTLFEDDNKKTTKVAVNLPQESTRTSLADSTVVDVVESNNTKVVSIVKPDATVELVQLKTDENNNTVESKVTSSREDITTTLKADASLETTSQMRVDDNLTSSTKVTLRKDGTTLNEVTFTKSDGTNSSLKVDSNLVGITTELKADGTTQMRTPKKVSQDGSESQVSVEITPQGRVTQTLIVTRVDGTQVITPMISIGVNPKSLLDLSITEEADGSITLKTKTLIPESGLTREQ